jgi:hypothetical protein
MTLLRTTSSLVTCLVAFTQPVSADNAFPMVSEASIANAGRNIMRTVDGGIVATYAVANGERSALIFARSLENGVTWDQVEFPAVTGDVRQAAVDSNFKGSYIAFSERVGDAIVMRIAHTAAPFAEDPAFVVSASVAPVGVVPADVYIQASRKGWGQLSDVAKETVAYGWQDANTGALYVGVSPDGETFPLALKVLEDPYAASGPAVAVRGNYVVASYQTTNPDIVPSDVPEHLRAGRTYTAWIESMDGGLTWSEPRPVFGHLSTDFPLAKIVDPSGEVDYLRLAGGTALPNSPTLNWGSSRSRPDRGGNLLSRADDDPTVPSVLQTEVQFADAKESESGLTFVQTSMNGIGADGAASEVSIVSFRQIMPGAPWTHVVAHNQLTSDPSLVDAGTSTLDVDASQFQYSALIDTKIRATSYKEVDTDTGASRLVIAVSTDTGMSFDHHVSFGEEELAAHGITGFGPAGVFTVSQCLYEDRNGEVYVDVMVSSGDGMRFVSLPTGVNAAVLRQEEHAELMILE